MWLNIFLAVFCVAGRTSALVASGQPLFTQLCMDCICRATSGCNRDIGCIGDKCGPFLISWQNWAAAGYLTVDGQAVTKGNEYFTCVTDPACAQRTVESYMRIYGRDCNGDGVITCEDYLHIHVNGIDRCSSELPIREENAYNQCKQETFPETSLVPSNCQSCICQAASGCNKTEGCFGNACGPYKITWPYWSDAGKPTIDGNPVSQGNEYIQCVNDMACAQRTVEGYMRRYGRDCNNDGAVNCEDFSRIHFLGPYGCTGWREKKICQLDAPAVVSATNSVSKVTTSPVISTPPQKPVQIIIQNTVPKQPARPVQKVQPPKKKFSINLFWNNYLNDDYLRKDEINHYIWDDKPKKKTEDSDDDSDSSDWDLLDYLFF